MQFPVLEKIQKSINRGPISLLRTRFLKEDSEDRGGGWGPIILKQIKAESIRKFSQAPIRNFLWCQLLQMTNYIFSPRKMKKKTTQYALNYSGTRFLSTENKYYSISWWIPS